MSEVPLVIGLLELWLNLYDGWFGTKGISAVKIDLRQAFVVDGKGVTLFGAVFVDAARGVAGVIFDEKGAFEKDFAAIATLVAFALPVFHLRIDIFSVKTQEEKTAYFSDGLLEFFLKYI